MQTLATEWDQFLSWYAIYPRREARADAWKAWQQLRARRPELDALVSAVRQHAAVHDWCAARRQFIPLPASWLRGERWADEFDVPESVLPALPAAKLHATDRAPADHALIEAANAAWAEVRACNSRGETRPLLGWSDPRTEQARRAVSAALLDMGQRNAHFVQRDFVAAFCSVRLEAGARDNPNVVPMRRRA